MSLLLLLACVKAPVPPSPPAPPAEVPAAGPTGISATAAIAEDPVLAALLATAKADGPIALARLATLCDDVGARPSGSAAYDRAVAWGVKELQSAGLRAWTEPVTQPRWVRGAESLTWLGAEPRPMALLALGGSVGTPTPIEAEVVVIHDFSELGPQVAGKIVLYNKRMEEGVPTIEHYGPAVAYRSQGASRAAPFGAVAVLVRSVTTRSLYTPHTGALSYQEGVPKIPAAAVTPEDADRIDRVVSRGIPVRLRLTLGAHQEPDVQSAQVLAELRGGTHPDEVVLLGAHLDSWDVGAGAQDDGAGVIEVMEALRLIHGAGLTPARTIRVVLYANEEFGLSGGKAYAQAHGKDRHVVAMESDLGAGRPLAWGATGSPAQLAWLRAALAPLRLPVDEGGGGADISTLGPGGVLLAGLRPDDTHYFDIHHTNADTIDKIDPTALGEAVAAVTGFAWLTANAPEAPPAVPVPPAP